MTEYKANSIDTEVDIDKLMNTIPYLNADIKLYAHSKSDDKKSAQAMCIYKYLDVIYVALSFVNRLRIYTLDGILVQDIYSETLSHMNDMTYYDGSLYMTGNDTVGSMDINVINCSNYNIKTLSLNNTEIASYINTITGIQFDESTNTFYILGKNGENYIFLNCDSNFNNVKSSFVAPCLNWSEQLRQGIYVDENYIYYIVNRCERDLDFGYFNVILIFDKDNYSFCNKAYVPSGVELESICKYNGEFYFYFNCYSRVGMLYKGDIFSTPNVYRHYNDLGIGRWHTMNDVYLDYNTSSFLVNGQSSNTPYLHWYEMCADIVNQNISGIKVQLMSNTNSDTLRLSPPIIQQAEISGYGSNRKIKSFECDDLNRLALNNITLIGDKNDIKNVIDVELDGVSCDNSINISDSNVIQIKSKEYTVVNNSTPYINSNRVSAIRISSIPKNVKNNELKYFTLTNACTGLYLSDNAWITKCYVGALCGSLKYYNSIKNINLNYIQTEGTYGISSTETIENIPSNERGILEVKLCGEWVLQRYSPLKTNIIYERVLKVSSSNRYEIVSQSKWKNIVTS